MNIAPHRYRGLDAVRGLCALGVMLFHYRAHFGAAPFESWLAPVYASGMYLVDVFFVMSGYLLATVYRGRSDFGGLAWARVARLLPLHLATLLLVAVLQYCYVYRHDAPFVYPLNDLRHFLLNALMLNSSGLQANFSFNGPAWSISVEWLANLMLFAVLALCRKRLLPFAIVLCLLAAWALWAHTGHLLSYGLFKGWLDANLLRGVVGFFAGVVLVYLRPLPVSPSGASAYVWDAGFLIATAGLIFFLGSEPVRSVKGADFAFVLLLVPLLVASACHGYWTTRLLDVAPLRWLGHISFSVYLLHFPMQLLFALVLDAPAATYATMPVFSGYIVATLAFSWLAWTQLEKPAQTWLKDLWRRKPVSARQ